MTDPIEHADRVNAVIEKALQQSVRGYSAAASSLIRERMESCLATALATCKEDRAPMHKRIDKARSQ